MADPSRIGGKPHIPSNRPGESAGETKGVQQKKGNAHIPRSGVSSGSSTPAADTTGKGQANIPIIGKPNAKQPPEILETSTYRLTNPGDQAIFTGGEIQSLIFQGKQIPITESTKATIAAALEDAKLTPGGQIKGFGEALARALDKYVDKEGNLKADDLKKDFEAAKATPKEKRGVAEFDIFTLMLLLSKLQTARFQGLEEAAKNTQVTILATFDAKKTIIKEKANIEYKSAVQAAAFSISVAAIGAGIGATGQMKAGGNATKINTAWQTSSMFNQVIGPGSQIIQAKGKLEASGKDVEMVAQFEKPSEELRFMKDAFLRRASEASQGANDARQNAKEMYKMETDMASKIGGNI